MLLKYCFAFLKHGSLWVYRLATVAVLVADALESAGFGATHRGLRYGLLTIAILTALAGVALPWLLSSGYYAVAGIWPTGSVLVATGVLAAVLILRGGFAPAIAVFAAGFVALNYLFVARVLPDVERFKPVEPLARTFLSRASPEARPLLLTPSPETSITLRFA